MLLSMDTKHREGKLIDERLKSWGLHEVNKLDVFL
jgi:hypothetical protein